MRLNSSALPVQFVENGRDLRLDFLRGLVMIVVVCVHLEYLSILSLFMWERLGIFSSAEGFVSLSGVVLGIVYKKRLFKEGFRATAIKLWLRAFQLYRVNVAMTLSILALSYVPWINVFQVTHWVSPVIGGPTFFLFPALGSSWISIFKQVLLLEVGPHQFQVIGLYCFLIGFSPVVMYLLYRQHTRWIIFLSWSLYALNAWLDIKITHARFELGFPILSWQLLFFNGMVIGFHHNKVFDFLADSRQRKVVFGAAIIAVLFLVFAAYNPEPLFWPWDTLNYFSVTTYKEIYMMWFQKSRLGFGRVLNNIVVYMSLFAFISYYWQICYRWLGGFLIPIGQSSLYVFVWHVFFVLFWSNTPVPGYHNIWLNTLIHVSSIALIWLMVKKKFLFSIVPR